VKGSYVILKIEFDAIRNFLEHVNREALNEIETVLERNDASEFEDIDDFDNALYNPVVRQEIAARAIYYELNAIIEHELQKSVHSPWLESTRHRGLKGLDLNNLTTDSIRSLKMIEDLPFREVVELIEAKYKIRLRDLEGGVAFFEMREMVNAFKHRHRLIDFRKRALKDFKFPEHYQAGVDRAYEFIDTSMAFIKALWQATDRQPNTFPRHNTPRD
jgi:hypothetical protein